MGSLEATTLLLALTRRPWRSRVGGKGVWDPLVNIVAVVRSQHHLVGSASPFATRTRILTSTMASCHPRLHGERWLRHLSACTDSGRKDGNAGVHGREPWELPHHPMPSPIAFNHGSSTAASQVMNNCC